MFGCFKLTEAKTSTAFFREQQGVIGRIRDFRLALERVKQIVNLGGGQNLFVTSKSKGSFNVYLTG